MGATSVTGVSGPGDSEGEYKSENSRGCCGGGTAPETASSEQQIVVNDNIRTAKGCSP